MAHTATKIGEAAAAPLIAFIVYALLHVLGIGMVVDGWAAWQGAVSLASGHGYTYLSGEPVRAWPPLYSLYMAAWFVFTGPFGWSLIAANLVLIAAQALCWYQLTRILSVDSGLQLNRTTSLALALFLGLYLNALQWQVFSHNLVYVLLPLFIICVWRCARAPHAHDSWYQLACATALGGALMVTHNSCVAFVCSAALMIVLRRPNRLLGVVQAGILFAAPLVVWKLVRDALNQTGSHPIGLGNGRYTLFEYLEQTVHGTGQLLVPDRLLAPLMIVLLCTGMAAWLFLGRKAAALRFGIYFSGASLAVLLVIFNLTWVANELNGRFLIYVPLLILLPLFVLAREMAPNTAIVVAALFILPQAYWTTSWGLRQVRETLAEQGFPNDFALPKVYLSRSYLTGPPVQTEHGILISPLSFNDPAGRKTSAKTDDSN